MKLAVFILTLFTSLNAFANVDTAGIALGTSGWNTNYTLTIFHEPTHNGDYTQVGLNFSPVTVRSINVVTGILNPAKPASISLGWGTVDVGVDVYGGHLGQEFSANAITSGSLTYLSNGYSSGNPFYLPSFNSVLPTNNRFVNYSQTGTFYLALNSGQNYGSYINGSYNNPSQRSIFGWAEFSYDATGITLINSAVTYDQAGIFIGTTNTIPVPESSSSAMLLAGLGLFGFMVRLRKLS